MDRSPRGGPLYLAWRILDEARDYFRTSWVPSPGSATLSHQMGEGLAEQLAHRAFNGEL
jgi:malate synthase